jgi:hypothetical protein
MLRSSSSWQDASGLEQREKGLAGGSRGVEGGGNERPLVAGMDAQRNLASMPGLSLTPDHGVIPAKTLSPSPAWDFHRLFEFLGYVSVNAVESAISRPLALFPGSFIFMRRAAHSFKTLFCRAARVTSCRPLRTASRSSLRGTQEHVGFRADAGFFLHWRIPGSPVLLHCQSSEVSSQLPVHVNASPAGRLAMAYRRVT